jgi:ABC-type multidrug transport system fused ATPase/permease subunit
MPTAIAHTFDHGCSHTASSSRPSGELFGVLATVAVLLVGMAIGPEGGLTVGTLVAFVFLVAIFLEPVAEFTEILDMTPAGGGRLEEGP